MHSDGKDYVNEAAHSFEQTALLSGVTADEALLWKRRMTSLDVGCMTTIDAEFEFQGFKYVEFEYFPPQHQYTNMAFGIAHPQ